METTKSSPGKPTIYHAPHEDTHATPGLQKNKNAFSQFQEYEQQLKAYGIPVQAIDWKQLTSVTPTPTTTTASSTTSTNVLIDSFNKNEQPILSPSSSVVTFLVLWTIHK